MTLVKLGLKLSPLLRRSVFIGRLAFRISIWYKRFGLILGRWSQRAIEYPWLLSVLDKFVPPGSKVLDVGCAESALSHELVARGHEVWCIDINDPLFAPPKRKIC
jgi:2-polyprenyl-3-methyl-5-hydroxy-6-metoxy-1,4-benzoquinol methylase